MSALSFAYIAVAVVLGTAAQLLLKAGTNAGGIGNALSRERQGCVYLLQNSKPLNRLQGTLLLSNGARENLALFACLT